MKIVSPIQRRPAGRIHQFRCGNDWQDIFRASIIAPEQLASHLPVHLEAIRNVVTQYPMCVNPYYLSLIRIPEDPIWRQAVPHINEIQDTHGTDDPLSEENQSPVPNLIHRYPDRVVFLVSDRCAVFCRFCMRKRKMGNPFGITREGIRAGLAYIRQNKQIRDVILSGGDPLLLENEAIYHLLEKIRAISHVEIIRIHTRVLCTLPQRITEALVRLLKNFHPIYINTHFNHPDEITAEVTAAATLLADAGIPLGCQTVLLKDVNDDPTVMTQLMRNLLRIRIKPYYLHHPDLVRGTGHFSVSLEKGFAMMDALRGHLSGMAVPYYMIDLPKGGGKIPLLPEYVIEKTADKWLIRNYNGNIFEYPLNHRTMI